MSATTATAKKTAPAEKAAGEKSQRTLSRKVRELEEKVETLEDLAELHIETAFQRFEEGRRLRRPIPQVIYEPTPCGCHEQKQSSGDSWFDIAFWLTVGVVVVTTLAKGKNKGE